MQFNVSESCQRKEECGASGSIQAGKPWASRKETYETEHVEKASDVWYE